MTDTAFASRCREEMLFAVFLLGRFKKQFASVHWDMIDDWIESIDNWETCDQLAMCVAGEILARAERPQQATYLRDLKKWVISTNPWRRRFAVVATTALSQKGRTDASPALQVCELAVSDSHKSVQAAVAWALREACKSDAGAVLALLKKRGAMMPRAVLRQSAEKLSTSQRAALGITSKAK
jgi:3-methyladenine DNA glycosylase AlkD